MQKHILKLYVAGQNFRSENAIRNLRQIYEEHLGVEYDLEVIDILVTPQVAEDDHILATPTLVRQSPEPARRIIGDLTNIEQVLAGLGTFEMHLSQKRDTAEGDRSS